MLSAKADVQPSDVQVSQSRGPGMQLHFSNACLLRTSEPLNDMASSSSEDTTQMNDTAMNIARKRSSSPQRTEDHSSSEESPSSDKENTEFLDKIEDSSEMDESSSEQDGYPSETIEYYSCRKEGSVREVDDDTSTEGEEHEDGEEEEEEEEGYDMKGHNQVGLIARSFPVGGKG
ncbi:uncharacterized protein B0T15DRAFT_506480 [Chaetomium strumarium]|uniref:Uncharacterized protein n=1 Tax=Chaetomium strumarium TaxID=1170767 RepID=A0AAJ0M5N9_9PEZI|nr:hypothetical protein B0T15DRAFT_506480 [Chaetomium strumarium]